MAVVSLEEFFDGNDDGASIWCNLENPYEPSEVLDILKGIRARDDVVNVLIMVTQFDGGDDEWPFADTVLFVTSGSPQDVCGWIGRRGAPDEIWIEDTTSVLGDTSIPSGMNLVRAWWD